MRLNIDGIIDYPNIMRSYPEDKITSEAIAKLIPFIRETAEKMNIKVTTPNG
jgi:hypothetical protein